MKQKLSILGTLTLCTFLAAACHKSETTSTDSTDTSTTSVASTDTASTMSTSGTGTSGTGASATTGTPAASLSKDDQEFLTKAAQGGIAEVELGTTASQKGASADVKAFGNQMVTDHSKANDELKQLAQQKGFAVPAEPNAEQKELASKLATKTGKAFDENYTEAMVKDHEEDVKEFEKASKDANDPDVKAWAAKTLPTLQHHLQMAKDAHKKTK